jgi:hypothetical protein
VVLKFVERVELRKSWIGEKAAELAAGGTGGSVEDVEALLRRHAEFEGLMAATQATVVGSVVCFLRASPRGQSKSFAKSD